MSGTQTLGFDVVYEISLGRFQRVLELLFIEDLPLRLGSVNFSVPVPGSIAGIVQTGTISLPDRPTASIARDPGNANRFTVTLAFPRALLSLDAVPAGGLLATGLAGLPVTLVGATSLTLPLNIDTTTSGNQSPVTIAVPATPTASMTPLSNLGAVTLPLLAGGTQATMRTAVQNAATSAVVSSVQSLFPLARGVTLPTSGPCDLFVRNMRMKLLAGDATHAESLSFLLNLQASSTGNFTGTTVSRLPTGNEGVLLISNNLLLELICCLLPRSASLSDLAATAPTRTTSPSCCRWSNIRNFRLGTETVDLQRFDVCVGTNSIDVSGAVRKSGTGWWATASFTVSVTLRNNAGVIEPRVGAPQLVTDSGVEWWVWLIAGLAVIVAAIIGFFVGGPLGSAVGGAIVGGLIGALVSAIVVGVLHAIAAASTAAVRAALGTLAGTLDTLQLLPADLADLFGVLTLVGDPVIDDLALRGQVVLPDSAPVHTQAANQIIDPGQTFNLDRGAVEPRYATTGFIDPDADLSWGSVTNPEPANLLDDLHLPMIMLPGGGNLRISRGDAAVGSFLTRPSIHSLGSARLVALPGTSFWALTESDLMELTYPDTSSSISNFFVPHSDLSNPPQPVVFAVRTTEGRYAKCQAWQDSRGRLHLRYRTYATRLPLFLVASWTSVRGEQLGTGVRRGMGVYAESKVSWRGAFRAETRSLLPPVSYQWQWDGRPISGTGTLPDGTTAFTVSGYDCILETQMGTSLNGELCVTARDASGFQVTACRAVNVTGTDQVFVRIAEQDGRFAELLDFLRRGPILDPPFQPFPPFPQPGPGPEFGGLLPLEAQLTRALAAGMKVAVEEVQLR